MTTIIQFKFETQTIHAGQVIDEFSKSRAVPIYQTSSYVFDTQHAQDSFSLAKPGNILHTNYEPNSECL